MVVRPPPISFLLIPRNLTVSRGEGKKIGDRDTTSRSVQEKRSNQLLREKKKIGGTCVQRAKTGGENSAGEERGLNETKTVLHVLLTFFLRYRNYPQN